jgi:hypothetical protein
MWLAALVSGSGRLLDVVAAMDNGFSRSADLADANHPHDLGGQLIFQLILLHSPDTILSIAAMTFFDIRMAGAAAFSAGGSSSVAKARDRLEPFCERAIQGARFSWLDSSIGDLGQDSALKHPDLL